MIKDEKISSMKKAWATPELATLGTVERLTQQDGAKCKRAGEGDDLLECCISDGTAC